MISLDRSLNFHKLRTMYEKLQELRHSLHQRPELSGGEVRTAGKLRDILLETEPDNLEDNVGGNGLLAVFRGSEPGPTVLLRCDIDAVPVQEDNDLSYRSLNPGVAHKCGHDGHMAVMAGVAGILHHHPPHRGTVLLLFQPGEETGTGASAVLEDPAFSGFHPDVAFAMHNLPGFPMGRVITSPGPFASASRGFIAELRGRSSHAGQPLLGRSPAQAAAGLIQQLEGQCVHREGIIVTVVHAVIGEIAFGTAPEKAVIRATLRAPDREGMERLSRNCVELVRKASASAGLQSQTSWTEEFPATVNTPEGHRIVRDSAESLGMTTEVVGKPFPWSEDFGHFTDRFGGALFGIGAGSDSPPLHDPRYDFPDRLIEPAVRLWARIIAEALEG